MYNGLNTFKSLDVEKEHNPDFNIKLSVSDLTPQNFGILSGPGFTLIYSILILFTGPLSDNFNRVKMICYSCLGWSLMTLLSSFSTEFWHLLVCRTGMAVFMSMFGPTTLSLISDFFPQEHRTFAFSIYAIGSQAGYPISTLNRPLIEYLGWRLTFRITAFLGFFAGLAGLVLLKEPERGRFDIDFSMITDKEVSDLKYQISESRYLLIN